ncbi:MAG: GNAT family N-acetyltransferase [Verrucomicrobiales bacterium]|nr:GNAT family N-acetyltransferase [Verrucomicrobiales bacterium]
MPSPRAIDMLTPSHAAALRALVADRDLAVLLGMSDPVSDLGVRDFVVSQLRRRAKDSAYLFVVQELQVVVGVCGWMGLEPGGERRLVCGIHHASRGKGLGTFAVGMMLEFAFRNLRWPEVRLGVASETKAWRRVLARNGMAPASAGELGGEAGVEVWSVSAEVWRGGRHASALAALHPALRAVLQAELSAGNEVLESHQGWPETGSVFVRVKHPFRVHADAQPEGVAYLELERRQPWRAEYHTVGPRHTLAC